MFVGPLVGVVCWFGVGGFHGIEVFEKLFTRPHRLPVMCGVQPRLAMGLFVDMCAEQLLDVTGCCRGDERILSYL